MTIHCLGLMLLAIVCVRSATADPFLWIEGEQASRTTIIANAGLDACDPQELSGKAWVSSFANGEQPTGMAEYTVEIPEPGTYRLWVRGTGQLAGRIAAGPWVAVNPKKRQGHLAIAADGNHGFPTISWFDLGTTNLAAGKHALAWRLGPETGDGRYGAVDCFVLTTGEFKPNDACKPGESPKLIPAFAPGEAWDFTPGKDAFDPAALLDLRDLNERTAGEHGFVRLAPDGESFLRGDGAPLRFWAAGLRTNPRKTQPEIQRMARFLAKRGVNVVRVFAMLPPAKPGKATAAAAVTDVNEQELDNVFMLIAALKEAGIYTILDTYWAVQTTRQPGWDLADSGRDDLEGLLYFDPKTQAAFRAWMRTLMTRPNPYTGVKLVDEPALAILQIQNEDSLLWWGFSSLKGEALDLLRRRFAGFLTAKYGSLDKAFAAWQGYASEFPADDPAAGLPGFLNVWDLTGDGWAKKGALPGFAARSADQLEFIAGVMRQFNTEMIAFLRKDLGCKQLINANNWRTVDLSTTMDAQYWADSVADVMARNIYSGGFHFGVNRGWQVLAGHIYEDKSLLKHPEELPSNVRQTAGRPYILPEALWTLPNLRQAESALVMAGQQSLTGLGAACWFSNFPDEWCAAPNVKWTYSTPMQIGQFPAAALIVRMGYLKRGEPAIEEHRSLADIWNRAPPMSSEDPGFDPNRDTGIARPAAAPAVSSDNLAYLVGPVRVHLDSDPAKSTVADLKKYIDRDRKIVRSITGEIETDYGVGVYRINAPKAQAAVGFLGAAGPQKLADVEIACRTPYAGVTVVALDDKPLRESAKVLVQIGTVARPTGWTTRPARIRKDEQWVDGQRIVSLGTDPWQVQNMDATLSLANPRLTKATALDANGMPTDTSVPVVSADGRAQLKLPADALYLVLTP